MPLVPRSGAGFIASRHLAGPWPWLKWSAWPCSSGRPRPCCARHDMLSDRVYRWLLKLYPEDFHIDYASDMAYAFREQCRRRGAARTWAEIIPDLTLSAWKEH